MNGHLSLVRTIRTIGRVAGAIVSCLALITLFVAVEALETRKTIRAKQSPDEPRASGMFGDQRSGTPLELVMLGDSLAVGVGALRPEQTVGALLANGLAEVADRPVRLINVAVTGSQSKELGAQTDALVHLTKHPDVAVIVVGGNDVMRRDSVAEAARHLFRAVLDLRRLGCRVVVASCPDMGTVRPLIQPLRYIARRTSRSLAKAQNLVVLRAGGRTVPLGDTLGPIFWHKPQVMFATDHFHPSAAGYARAAALLMPTVSSAAAISWGQKEQRRMQGTSH